MVDKVINAEEIGIDLEVNPEFAIQVYSTLPLDSDHTALCEYLCREIDTWPSISLEIYSPQPDVFACVEHQRREIAHRKTTNPGEGFFPGIAKAVPNLSNRLPQGFLLVITSHSYRAGFRAPSYEDEAGFLEVNFNRSFPLKTKVDEHSRLQWVPLAGYIPSAVEKSDINPEREEIKVWKCRDSYEPLRQLNLILKMSYINDDGYDYGLDDDEGDPDSLNQLPAPEIIESWQLKANSYPHDDFSVQSPTEGAVLIRSKVVNIEPDLQYVIYVSFAHTSSQLLFIAQVFTAAVIENLRCRKTINFEYHSAPSQSLSAILASHRNVMNARPDMAVGAYKHESQTRIFPQHRQEDYPEIVLREREPYQTFFVIVDRPDFLTAPGVLFFLTDGNEVTDEWRQKFPEQRFEHERAGYWPYQVWRSAGMPEVARRLAMLGLE
jgi:hypothetical protein